MYIMFSNKISFIQLQERKIFKNKIKQNKNIEKRKNNFTKQTVKSFI